MKACNYKRKLHHKYIWIHPSTCLPRVCADIQQWSRTRVCLNTGSLQCQPTWSIALDSETKMFGLSEEKVLSFLISLVSYYFLIIEGKKVLKVDPLSPYNTSAELKNSSLSSFAEFTLCGRILSHQFSSGIQSILLVEYDGQLFGLGTSPGLPCDESYYQGNFFNKVQFSFNITTLLVDLTRLHWIHEVRAWK